MANTHYESLLQGSTILREGDVEIPLSYEARAKGAIKNPVAVVTQYRALIEDTLSILLGVELKIQGNGSKKVRSKYFLHGNKGVFGYVVALFGVNETQARGALHFHLVLFGSLPPSLLESAASFPDVCAEISKVLDSMYTAELPRNTHVAHMIEKELPFKRGSPFIMQTTPSPKHEPDEFVKHGVSCTKHNGIHAHSFTCHKAPNGYIGCRLCKKSGISSETKPVQLDPRSVNQDTPTVLPQVQPQIQTFIGPIPLPDNRVIAWELKRPLLGTLMQIPSKFDNVVYESEKRDWILEHLKRAIMDTKKWSQLLPRLSQIPCDQLELLYNKIKTELPQRNGYVVEYNNILTNLTGSHTAPYLLGNAVQSKSSLFYIAPYIGKEKKLVAQILTAMYQSKRKINDNPSQADDTGTDQRWITATLNNLDCTAEYSDTQAVSSLLGFPIDICTSTITYIPTREALNYVTALRSGFFQNEPLKILKNKTWINLFLMIFWT